MIEHMKHRTAVLALATAGVLWGSSVALSKLSLDWLDSGWLTVMRFAVSAPVLALIGRKHLRRAFTWRIAVAGGLGYGVTILFQNAGIEHTSVSHAAILVGAVPVFVAIAAAGFGHGNSKPLIWLGYGVAMLGIVFVARGGGGGATTGGDMLVLTSSILCAVFIALQPLLLKDQDAAAVTAVQFFASTLVSAPFALISGGLPHAPASGGPVIAFVALAIFCTVLPFWLFAHGQKGASAELAGAMVNIEPLVGAVIGWVGFGDPVGPWQIVGALAVAVGILLSVVPWERISFTALAQRPRTRSGLI